LYVNINIKENKERAQRCSIENIAFINVFNENLLAATSQKRPPIK